MCRPFNVLIRDVTCRTISTDDGNLNCCFVSQRGPREERRGQRERECPPGTRCAYMHKYVREWYVSGVRHFIRAFHATYVTGRFGKIRCNFAAACAPTLPESARFFLFLLEPWHDSKATSFDNEKVKERRILSLDGCRSWINIIEIGTADSLNSNSR